MLQRFPPAALVLALLSTAASAAWPSPAAPTQGAVDQTAVVWEVLQPTRVTSVNGVEHELLEDRSILAVGEFAARDTVVVDFELELPGISAVRVEALRDERLPAGGPGLGDGGLFKLAEVRVGVSSSTRSRTTQPVPIIAAVGTPDDLAGPARHAADSNVATAWGPSRTVERDLEGVFFLGAPLADKGRGILRVELDQNHADNRCLGRFRISVTRDPQAGVRLGAMGDEVDAELAAAVDQAIRRGVGSLLRGQQLDGSWRYLEDSNRTGSTALAVYTLIKCGVGRDHPSVVRGIEYVLAHPGDNVYVASIQIMALALFDPVGNLGRIDELAEYLVETEVRGWAYPVTPSAEVDLSNTQYALLALRTAADLGVEIPSKVWKNAAKATLKHRERSKGSDPATGFGYRVGHDPTGAMTAAGITILAIAAEQVGKNTEEWERAVEEGVLWLAREFSVTRNPKPARAPGAAYDDQDRWWGYYLYGLERVAGLLHLDHIGPHDWYAQGARMLLDHQNEYGVWTPRAYGDDGQEVSDSCFALLFLSRATGATTGESSGGRRPTASSGGPDDDVQVRAAGDAPWRIWIQGYSEDALDEVQWPDGGGLRVAEVRWELVDSAGQVLEVLERVDGVADRDALLVRFPVELRFRDRGDHRVRVTVEALLADGERVALRSKPVTLHTDFVDRPELLDYARDSGDNLLARAERRTQVSSELGGQWNASKATDGLQAKGWISADDDSRPSIKIELEEPVRADTLLLSRAHEPWSAAPWRTGRVAAVTITLNGDTTFEVELIDDDWTKTQVDLGRRRRIKEIEIRVREVTGVHPDHPDYAGVGFGEIELRDSKP
ncbi:hypothetical protein [Engelhardtia mirabilis]|uniref:F5/8 type C domain protein n=1 Tax=Engelhardtia mirabilis TaxID=2528011 RepID=A0A518BIZ2_9BACT|nr:hypothetical protein Pla133_19890 [Planctomycetes bacterium Pla133]QDV01240.1 hypothetical protein Pla86_19890 [Planctomycetes bacterium Pla86]